jgi:hypothetical protein
LFVTLLTPELNCTALATTLDFVDIDGKLELFGSV